MPGGNVEAATTLDVEVNQRNQGQQRAQQGIEEKFESRINFVRPAPDTDDQVHGDQGGFEEHVEQHAVERAKDADHQPRQNQECGHVLLYLGRDGLPTGNHHNQVDKGRERHKPEGNTVQPQVVAHIEAVNPGQVLHELHGRAGIVKLGIQRQGDQKTDQRANQGKPARAVNLVVTPKGQQDQSECNRGPDGKAQKSHGGFLNSKKTGTTPARPATPMPAAPAIAQRSTRQTAPRP